MFTCSLPADESLFLFLLNCCCHCWGHYVIVVVAVDGDGDDDTGEQIIVPKALIVELVGLRVAYAKLQNKYRKVIQSNPEAQSEFVELLPGLLNREITSGLSFQAYFKILVEEEVSLFNITHLKKICVIFTGDVR